MMRYASLLPAIVGLALGAPPTETVRNERVVAIDGTVAARKTETVAGVRPSVTVYFTDGDLEVTPAGGKPRQSRVKRGQVIFEPAQSRTVKNTGSADVRFVRVEFLGAGTSETWGAAGLSPHYKLLLENEYTRAAKSRSTVTRTGS